MSASDPLLVARSVDVVRGEAHLLRNVSVSFARGERVAVLGPNGAGKTTLLRVLGGWLEPTAGDVHLDGRALRAWGRRAAARRIGAVLVEDVTPFAASVRDVVSLGRQPWRAHLAAWSEEDTRAVSDALAACALETLVDRDVATLSSGERQRVGLARVLAQAPDVLLVDEASAHLDVGQRASLLRTLTQAAVQRAVVAVFHDLDLASAWATRVLLLEEGKVVADGPPEEVLDAGRLGRLFGVTLTRVDVPGGGSVFVPIHASDEACEPPAGGDAPSHKP